MNVRVQFLGAILEVLVGGGRFGNMNIISLFSKYWLSSRNSAMLFTSNVNFASVNWLALDLLDSTLCFVKVTLSWEGLMN